ncbi:Metal dependent phosphohydrolase [Lasiodiplodia theobromae]|uniref:Metal dependent phosphohydrolase n=1 Tax=Lasiodiplodia theobromae TaxID=45133 RepID=UPI0015C37450|nr:Metal dependent phosphohydrolase [Lasiodiplodia theobromae]KAF4543467.1 Metal dependent phosphohydrolase [Lasiodiplodia theobromae]
MPPPTTQPSLFPSLPTLPNLTPLLPSTPLIHAALAHAHKHLPPFAYNHVVRSWLFATLITQSHPTLKHQSFDHEVVALACILHDLAWAPSGAFTSAEKRFEVDGADGAVAFLAAHAPEGWDDGSPEGNGVLAGGNTEGTGWEGKKGCREGEGEEEGKDFVGIRGYKGRKTQRVWDACALHTTMSVAFEKEPVTAVVATGIWADFQGPTHTNPPDILITWPEYDAIVQAYPRLGLIGEVKQIMCGLCVTKPQSTYDNSVGDWGEKFVEAYSRVGHRGVDALMQFTPELDARDA